MTVAIVVNTADCFVKYLFDSSTCDIKGSFQRIFYVVLHVCKT